MIKCAISLFLDKHFDINDFDLFYKHINTFIYNAYLFIIFDKYDNSLLINDIKDKYPNIDFYINNQFKNGEASFVKQSIDIAINNNQSYIVCLRTGYYYEDNDLDKLLEYAIDNSNYAIYSPNPIFDIEEKSNDSTIRCIKSCKFIGVVINLDIYQKGYSIDESYYMSGYEADYAINVRKDSYNIIYIPYLTLRNINYEVVYKKILFTKFYSYKTNPIELYYRERNRFIIYDKYEDIDKDYILLDKELRKKELKEFKSLAPNYKELKTSLKDAHNDYNNNIMNNDYQIK